MEGQKGVIAPLILVIILGSVIIVAATYILKTFFPSAMPSLPNPTKIIQNQKQEPKVSLKTEYQNPFDKVSQYVNPFSDYQNPFDAIK